MIPRHDSLLLSVAVCCGVILSSCSVSRHPAGIASSTVPLTSAYTTIGPVDSSSCSYWFLYIPVSGKNSTEEMIDQPVKEKGAQALVGVTVEYARSTLVPYDGDPAFLETTAYPLNKFYKTLGDLPAKRVTVVLDTCFSGAGGRSVIAKGARPMLIHVESPVMASPNLVVLAAAAGNQISSAYLEKRHGLFTYYFLKGIQGEADANQDRTVDLEELDTYVRSNVQGVARRMNVDQSPTLLPGIEGAWHQSKSPSRRIKA